MATWQESLEAYAVGVESEWRNRLAMFIEAIQRPNGFAHEVEWKALEMAKLEYEAAQVRRVVDKAKTFTTGAEAVAYLMESETTFRAHWINSIRAHNSTNPIANALEYARMEAEKRFLTDAVGSGIYDALRRKIERAQIAA